MDVNAVGLRSMIGRAVVYNDSYLCLFESIEVKQPQRRMGKHKTAKNNIDHQQRDTVDNIE